MTAFRLGWAALWNDKEQHPIFLPRAAGLVCIAVYTPSCQGQLSFPTTSPKDGVLRAVLGGATAQLQDVLSPPASARGRRSAYWAFCCHRLPPGGRAAPCSAPSKIQRPFLSLTGSFPCYYHSPFLLIPQVLQEWGKDAVCEYCTESKQSNFHAL